jgi:hypothetical protein
MQRLLLFVSVALSPLVLDSTARAQATDVPNPGLLQQSLCGSRLTSDVSLVVGSVRDAAGETLAGIRVAALWTEAVVTRGGSQVLLRASIDTSATDGTFALCGVPRETRVLVRADGLNVQSGELSLLVGDVPVIERELVVAGPSPTSVVTGILRGANGTAISATIDLTGDSASTTTDSSGIFRLRAVPRRSSQLRVRAIGYQPLFLDVTPDGPTVDLGAVVMSGRVEELREIRIEETRVSRERREFEERRSSHVGAFFDSDFLKRFPVVSANALGANSGLIRGRSGAASEQILLRRAAGECWPLVFLNGVRVGRQGNNGSSIVPPGVTGDLMAQLLREADRIEAYAAHFSPAEFADFEGCGAVAIWTR